MYYEKLKDLGIELRNKRGQQKVVCPKCSPTRKNKREPCLSVNVDTGDYNCHNTGCEFRGTVRTSFRDNATAKKEYKYPPIDDAKKHSYSEGVKVFFEKRGISEDTLKKFFIYSREEWMPQIQGKTNAICFPYFGLDLKLTNIKFRDQRKNFKLVSGAKLIPFNLNSIINRKFVIITEGEIDAMSIVEAGIGTNTSVNTETGEVIENFLDKWAVISVPNGASLGGNAKLEYLDNCAEALMEITEFIVATDGDEAGEALKEELCRRLGVEKCRLIKYPKVPCVPLPDGGFRPPKDLNEVLVHMGKDVVRSIILASEYTQIEGIYYVRDIADEMMDNFRKGVQLAPTTRFGGLDRNFRWKYGDINVWTGWANHGKALALDTKIPTPDGNGWTIMGDLKKGDRVYDENGKICMVTFATEPMLDRECYNVVFNDGTSIIADAEHLWFTHTFASRRSQINKIKKDINRSTNKRGSSQECKRILPKVRTTKEILETLTFEKSGIKRPNHSIDFCKPIDGDYVDFDIHPYCLGVWLGDGSKSGASITSADPFVMERVRSLGYDITKRKDELSYGIVNGFLKKLRKNNLLNNKHIPRAYLRCSIEQRIELLRGLMDTDGYIEHNGICEFTTIIPELAEQFRELIVSLGMKGNVTIGDAKLNGRFISKKYRIAFKPNFQVFYLPRKANKHKDKCKNNWRYIKSITRVNSVPVKCISVDSPSKLYLCSESFIPTHNTTVFLQLALTKSIYDGWKWAIFSPENFPPTDFYDDLIEMYCGKWLDKITEEEYAEALSFLNDHFFYVYPEDSHDLLSIHEKFRYLILKHGIDGVLIDPWNQLDSMQKSMEREDMYLSRMLKDVKRFALLNKVLYNIIAHPKNPTYNADKSLPVADMYDLHGGSMWGNKADQIISYYRPNAHLDKTSPNVELWIQKTKRRRTGGENGVVPMHLDWSKKRYCIDNIYPCDPILAKQILSQEGREIYAQEQLTFENKTEFPEVKVEGEDAPF